MQSLARMNGLLMPQFQLAAGDELSKKESKRMNAMNEAIGLRQLRKLTEFAKTNFPESLIERNSEVSLNNFI